MIVFIRFHTTPFGKKCPKMRLREESYEGHLKFKSVVSPLFFPLEEEEGKKHLEPNLIVRQKTEN